MLTGWNLEGTSHSGVQYRTPHGIQIKFFIVVVVVAIHNILHYPQSRKKRPWKRQIYSAELH